jgi:ribosomal-protein-alanine N-acetyltransferase
MINRAEFSQERIESQRFFLRPLTENDVTLEYLGWLSEPVTKKYISASKNTENLAQLKSYVRMRLGRSDVCFLGIFDKTTGKHIGNIKYEPVQVETRYAVMGILIGDAKWRGLGVFSEVFEASAHWLYMKKGITKFELGVDKTNISAIRSYEKAGFKRVDSHYISTSEANLIMGYEINEL